ncbi:MAG: 1,4-alpha-glucan branching protein GlgB [Clostridia bacterium]|nr:1,4-alpha-glucan branching protein GlgB [Clostridia bacterium]
MALITKDSYPIYLFHEGTNFESYKLMSPTPVVEDDVEGWFFRVWAPFALNVSIVGDFNKWDVTKNPMESSSDGIWSLFIAGLKEFDNYKYAVTGKNNKTILKCDPYGLHFETPPANSSKLYDITGYNWKDKKWMTDRMDYDPYGSPMNIYELHIGSWKRYSDGNFYNYSALADELIPYVKKMGYTHIEVMPLTEYPFDGSWGYQVTGMFAPTSRYGTPKDLMLLIDKCHRAGIGVILDWVLAHFPRDEHGLGSFDGTALYEYADPRKGEHKEWGTKVYDFGKNEVKCFLISAAMFWFEIYHIDGIRCDAVASMLYLDYNRKDGEWAPNAFGGNYNLEAKDFLKAMNTAILSKHRGVLSIAEESTSFPMVTKPAYDGGLGFNFKWNMGWMNDSLRYLALDPFFRKDNHNDLTFSISYAYAENYILPLSHDEVVHGKHSMIDRVVGSYDEKFEGLKTFYGYMMGHPGKKLNFMGNEFGQFIEWNYTKELDWLLLEYPKHKALQKYVKDLNEFYLANKSLWQLDCSWDGFKWIVVDDNRQNVLSFIRKAADGEYVICVMNFSPVARNKYVMGVPDLCEYKTEIISSLKKYGGDEPRRPSFRAVAKPAHGYQNSIKINIPKNTVMFIKPDFKEEVL